MKSVEKDNQIKGKGNGDISPKYIDYVVQFFEWTGMKVRGSEMEHLGYIVPPFYQYVKNELYKGKYLRKNIPIEYQDDVVIFNDIEQVKNYNGSKKVLYSGSVDVSDGASLDLSNCTSVGSYVYVSDGASLDLSNCTSVGGSVDVSKGGSLELSNCTSVGSSVYVRDGATLIAPKLKGGK